MDERVVYPGQADREAAQERAELRYWKAHSQALEVKLEQPPPPPPPPPPSKPSKAVGQVFRDAPWSPEMVVLPSGKFLMGSPDTEPGRSADEGPQHAVTIAYPLAMGKYPVTFEEWDACVADGGTTHKPGDEGWGRGKRPVINVSWEDAQQYLAWLNQKLGIAANDPTRYRLPSEAEWEYACRAGTTTAYWWGNDVQAERCNGKSSSWACIKGLFDNSRTHPVDGLGAASTNAWGLSCTHGNVWEWVQDCYEDGYNKGQASDGSAHRAEDSSCGSRVLRGGSWINNPQSLRSAYRSRYSPGLRISINGFRLARTVREKRLPLAT